MGNGTGRAVRTRADSFAHHKGQRRGSGRAGRGDATHGTAECRLQAQPCGNNHCQQIGRKIGDEFNMSKKYVREEAIRLIETILQKLSEKAEEARERSLDDLQEDEAELYLRTTGAGFTESLKKAKLGSTLVDYDSNTIAILLEKCILAAAEYELEQELYEDFVIVENEDDIRKMLLGEILNRDVLFSGNYECLKDEFFNDFYRRTVSQENYVEGLGYFIDLYEILRRRAASITTPSFGIPDEYLFKPPAESFYIEPNASKRAENIAVGITFGSHNVYEKVHVPRMFNTTDDIIVIDTSHLYTEDGNLKNGRERLKEDIEAASIRPSKYSPPEKRTHRRQKSEQRLYVLIKDGTDRTSVIGEAVISMAQEVCGVVSAWNLNRLFVSIWTEEYENCKMNFFTIQIPRCNNLNQEYWYVPVSCSDSDFKKIMEWVRTSCTKK